MPDSIWTATLAAFRDRVAGPEPVPAGVSASAVSAALGLGLLTKVLEIASKRKDFAGDRQLVETLLHDARNRAQFLAHLADEDIAAFHQYLDCRRRKEPTDRAIRRAIEIPLDVARASAAGVALCRQAGPLVHAAVASDLRTAQALLTAAVHSTLIAVDSNLRQLAAGDPFGIEVTAEARRIRAELSLDV
jgi:formiminotetrahydrofolate cyclodeaminase